MLRRIKIFDTTLRDGEQSPGASMSIDQKVKMARSLDQLGVDYIEAGFPISSPVQFEGIQKVSQCVKNATVVALARCVKKDIDCANEALLNKDNRMLHIFLATSPLHREFKLKKSKEQVLESIREGLQYARKFFNKIEFSAEDASRTEPDFLVEVVKLAIKEGATTINIPDTVGYTIPDEFATLIKRIVEESPEFNSGQVDLSVHCHNDLGFAAANSLTSIIHGASQVEVTLNGIGERAGNCSLEEIAMALKVREDIIQCTTGIKHDHLYASSKLLQSLTGIIVPGNKPIFGENVFSHESGIHQDGVLKHRETYEIMSPETIGCQIDNIVMGRHSGRHAFSKKLTTYGIDLTEDQFDEAFETFTHVADKKKEVYDEDILNIIASQLGKISVGHSLKYFHTYTGNSVVPSATVTLVKGEKEYTASSAGDGPVDAVFNAIDIALGLKFKLEEYIIQAIGSGKDAQGQVRLSLTMDEKTVHGKSSSTDVVEASALAYINAVNRHLVKGL